MAEETSNSIRAGEVRSHFGDVDRLIRFVLKKERVQAYRHLSRDEFDDIMSWCWVWVLEREDEWKELDCSLASAVCNSIPFAIKSWRARHRRWGRRAIVPESTLVHDGGDADDDRRSSTIKNRECDVELNPDALVESAELARALEVAIESLPARAREDLRSMLAGHDISEIATSTGRAMQTVRLNVFRAVGSLRFALFGDATPVRSLEPQVVSGRTRRRRERSLRWWRQKRDGAPRKAQSLTSEYEWGGRKPDACLGCQSTERRHKARGLCHRCYASLKRDGKLGEFGVILDTSPGAVNQ